MSKNEEWDKRKKKKEKNSARTKPTDNSHLMACEFINYSNFAIATPHRVFVRVVSVCAIETVPPGAHTGISTHMKRTRHAVELLFLLNEQSEKRSRATIGNRRIDPPPKPYLQSHIFR